MGAVRGEVMDRNIEQDIDQNIDQNEAHYRVVRYYEDQRHGVFKEVLEENMTFEEAEQFAGTLHGQVPGEDIVVQDQNIIGIGSEVAYDPYKDQGERRT
jgi:hypothetical protein